MSELEEDKGLQGLRGFSSMAVLMFHLGLPVLGAVGVFLVGWGYAGVACFFVISGFILGKKYLRGDYHSLCKSNETRRFDKFRYYSRRFFRIWPLYWITLPLFILICGLPFMWQDFAMLQYSVFAPQGVVLLPQWTLVIEEIFYISLPLWVLAMRHRYSFGILGALCALSIFSSFYSPFYYQLPQYAAAYAFGLLAAKGVQVKLPKWSMVPIVGATMAVLAFFNLGRAASGPFTIVAILVSYLILCNWREVWAFTNRWSVKLGALTYATYLLGVPIMWLLEFNFNLPWVEYAPLTLLLTVGLSMAVHRVFEKPMIGLGRSIEARFYQTRKRPWEIRE